MYDKAYELFKQREILTFELESIFDILQNPKYIDDTSLQKLDCQIEHFKLEFDKITHKIKSLSMNLSEYNQIPMMKMPVRLEYIKYGLYDEELKKAKLEEVKKNLNRLLGVPLNDKEMI